MIIIMTIVIAVGVLPLLFDPASAGVCHDVGNGLRRCYAGNASAPRLAAVDARSVVMVMTIIIIIIVIITMNIISTVNWLP